MLQESQCNGEVDERIHKNQMRLKFELEGLIKLIYYAVFQLYEKCFPLLKAMKSYNTPLVPNDLLNPVINYI